MRREDHGIGDPTSVDFPAQARQLPAVGIRRIDPYDARVLGQRRDVAEGEIVAEADQCAESAEDRLDLAGRRGLRTDPQRATAGIEEDPLRTVLDRVQQAFALQGLEAQEPVGRFRLQRPAA
ncbi:MAG TPA: hypothetical protein VKG78_11545 [Opitutaceae bacterium]|nr:hypothetical protein [Opitutaceae bacterium]